MLDPMGGAGHAGDLVAGADAVHDPRGQGLRVRDWPEDDLQAVLERLHMGGHLKDEGQRAIESCGREELFWRFDSPPIGGPLRFRCLTFRYNSACSAKTDAGMPKLRLALGFRSLSILCRLRISCSKTLA